MNYFAHAYRFLDDPYLATGTGVPDWLSVVDRRVRLRSKRVEPFVDHPDPSTAAVARGVLQHLSDDRRFHNSRGFVELNLELTVMARDALEGESGLRPAFLGHLLVEVLLDASLIAEDLGRLEAYYGVLESVDPGGVEAAVNRMAARPTRRLAAMIVGFLRHRILSDYLEDAKLFGRVNQVMRRVKLAELPEGFCRIFPDARRKVDCRKDELLDGIPVLTSRYL